MDSMFFLQELPELPNLPLPGPAVYGGPVTGLRAAMAAFSGIFAVFTLIFFALYVYLSLAYSRIGRKAGLSSPGIAWLPYTGPLVITFESSKMHWWPFLILAIGLALYPLSFAAGSAILALIILLITMVVFGIMAIVWHWKTYEAVGKPGWWILVPVISVIIGVVLMSIGVLAKASALSVIGIIITILGVIAHLILIGVAAWGGGPTGR
jgi:hypothetical protein